MMHRALRAMIGLGCIYVALWGLFASSAWGMAQVRARVHLTGTLGSTQAPTRLALVPLLQRRGFVVVAGTQDPDVIQIELAAGGVLVLQKQSVAKTYQIPGGIQDADVRARAIILFLGLFCDESKSQRDTPSLRQEVPVGQRPVEVRRKLRQGRKVLFINRQSADPSNARIVRPAMHKSTLRKRMRRKQGTRRMVPRVARRFVRKRRAPKVRGAGGTRRVARAKRVAPPAPKAVTSAQPQPLRRPLPARPLPARPLAVRPLAARPLAAPVVRRGLPVGVAPVRRLGPVPSARGGQPLVRRKAALRNPVVREPLQRSPGVPVLVRPEPRLPRVLVARATPAPAVRRVVAPRRALVPRVAPRRALPVGFRPTPRLRPVPRSPRGLVPRGVVGRPPVGRSPAGRKVSLGVGGVVAPQPRPSTTPWWLGVELSGALSPVGLDGLPIGGALAVVGGWRWLGLRLDTGLFGVLTNPTFRLSMLRPGIGLDVAVLRLPRFWLGVGAGGFAELFWGGDANVTTLRWRFGGRASVTAAWRPVRRLSMFVAVEGLFSPLQLRYLGRGEVPLYQTNFAQLHVALGVRFLLW